MQKKFSLIALVLSIFCLIGNLVMIFCNIIENYPYWQHIIWVFLMIAIAYSSYKTYKRQ